MKKKIFFILLLMLNMAKADIFKLDSTIVYKQAIEDKPTLTSVLNNYFVAIAGSKEKLKQIITLVSEGEMFFSQLPQTANIVIKYKFPNKYKSQVSIMGHTIIEGFDGTNSFSNVATISKDRSVEMQKKKGIFSELYYTDKDAVLDGKEKISGKEAYKVTVTEDDNKTVIYFDVNSGFKIKEEIFRDKKIITKEYSEYKDFGEYKLATKTISKVSGQIVTQTIKKYEINSELKDEEFKL